MMAAMVLVAALTLAGAPTAASASCTVDDATMTWGFKESFRSYISGTIANGEWTVADGATYSTPDFGWTGGAGLLPDGTGAIAFTGSITFTGHDGILNTTVANPQLRFDGSGIATLLLDVSGTTQEGMPVDERAVEFATIDLDGAVQGDNAVITSSPAVLTEAGAAAFGTYEAGEGLDPISAVLPGAADCDPALSRPDDLPGVTQVLAVVGVVFAAMVLVLVASAVLVVVLLARRRKRAAPSE
ncbi:MAG: hypothetical protein JWP85_351 [Rhodoglobus sp.]|nr:hypothetical protein [Rhodoglobus sp.]